ncbi:MAG: GlsB/YeaQ/YmgE family stress response membrane protein [Planctomycetota bacterium]
MGIWSILSWIVFGLVAGAIARFLVPGKQSMGWIMTTVLGVAGSFFGGFLFSLLPFGAPAGSFHATNLIGSVIGSVVLLLIYVSATKEK